MMREVVSLRGVRDLPRLFTAAEHARAGGARRMEYRNAVINKGTLIRLSTHVQAMPGERRPLP